jgi:aspartyl-tRNA(Asn)/glutamyl-tRNA(Gln) amidotransferase subunit A
MKAAARFLPETNASRARSIALGSSYIAHAGGRRETDLADYSVADLVAGYSSGAFSPVEVMEAVQRRIAGREPVVKALWGADPGRARLEAAESESRWCKGRPCGPFDGVPMTLKENIPTKGLPVPLGCAATELVPAVVDGPPAARLREAGAILLGKTTMPDLGMLSSGLSSFHELTTNPWNKAWNPGGSSAGSGADLDVLRATAWYEQARPQAAKPDWSIPSRGLRA